MTLAANIVTKGFSSSTERNELQRLESIKRTVNILEKLHVFFSGFTVLTKEQQWKRMQLKYLVCDQLDTTISTFPLLPKKYFQRE
jgi:hypothetical protein